MNHRPVLLLTALGGLLVAAASCVPPPPAEAGGAHSAEPAAKALKKQPLASYAAVPVPEGIVGTLRVDSLPAELRAMHVFAPPGSTFDKFLSEDPQKLAAIFLGSLGPHIDLTMPVDVIFFDKKRGSRQASNIAVSLVLRDVE